jgi:hypothetical protein
MTNCVKKSSFIFIAFQIWSMIRSKDGLCTPEGLEFEWKFRFLVYVYDVNLFVGWIQTIKKNTEALLLADKKIGLEFNAEKSLYKFMSYE